MAAIGALALKEVVEFVGGVLDKEIGSAWHHSVGGEAHHKYRNLLEKVRERIATGRLPTNEHLTEALRKSLAKTALVIGYSLHDPDRKLVVELLKSEANWHNLKALCHQIGESFSHNIKIENFWRGDAWLARLIHLANDAANFSDFNLDVVLSDNQVTELLSQGNDAVLREHFNDRFLRWADEHVRVKAPKPPTFKASVTRGLSLPGRDTQLDFYDIFRRCFREELKQDRLVHRTYVIDVLAEVKKDVDRLVAALPSSQEKETFQNAIDRLRDFGAFQATLLRQSTELGAKFERLEIGQRSHQKGLESLQREVSAFLAGTGTTAVHQLPPPPEELIGRQEELEQLRVALAEGHRILCLRGQGGVGKTGLAVAFAHEIAEQFPSGQIFLDLRGVSSERPLTPQAVMQHVISAWEPHEKASESFNQVAGKYRSLLLAKRALLVLDNVHDAAQVECLRPPGGSVLLLTSRHHFYLAKAVTVDLDTLPPRESCELLLKIAPRIADHAEPIAERCGYLPLALRLAGAAIACRMMLTPKEYLGRLKDARLLQFDAVSASLSLSYELLCPNLQAAWRKLGAFPGSFDKEAAAAVCQVDGASVRGRLEELYIRSLIYWSPNSGRAWLHDLAREFAVQRLVESGQEVATRLAHAEYYCEKLRAENERFERGGQNIPAALLWFENEKANIRVGQAWAATYASRDQNAARIAADYPLRGVHIVGKALEEKEYLAWTQIALSICQRCSDRHAEAGAYAGLGSAYENLGQHAEAVEAFERALEINRAEADSEAEGGNLCNLSQALWHLDQRQRAIECIERALAIITKTQNRAFEATTWHTLGRYLVEMDAVERAIAALKRSLKIDREIRHPEHRALRGLALAYSKTGKRQIAADYFRQAAAAARRVRDYDSECRCLLGLASEYDDLKKREAAKDSYLLALASAREADNVRLEARILSDFGAFYQRNGLTKLALEYFQNAFRVARRIRAFEVQAWVLGQIGLQSDSAGEYRQAHRAYNLGLKMARRAKDTRIEAAHLFNSALLFDKQNARSEAIDSMRQVLRIYEALEDTRAEKVRNVLQLWRADDPSISETP